MTDNFNSIVDKYGDSMYRCAFAYCKNRADAEDIVQEAFYKYATKRPIFNDEEHEKAWLLRVTINISKNFLRTFWYRKVELTEEDIPYSEGSEENEIWEMVNDLPSKYRIILELHFVEEYTIKEIAQILNQNVSTVGTRFERAKKMIKDRIESESR